MTVEKISDRNIRITEEVISVLEISLESLYDRKTQIEKELSDIDEKIKQAEKLGVMRGY